MNGTKRAAHPPHDDVEITTKIMLSICAFVIIAILAKFAPALSAAFKI